jgi:hypothetical protein
MLESLFNTMFGCSHERTTFPITPGRMNGASRTYVACLECGKEFAYDWKEMRIGQPVKVPVAAVEPQPMFR